MRTKLLTWLAMVLFSGCTISGRYYLRNLTNQTAVVTVTSFSDLEITDSTDLVFHYEPEVKEIKFSLYKRLNQALTARQVNSQQIQFTIPPHSTVFLGNGINFYPWGIQSLSITTGEKTIKLDASGQEKMNLKSRGLLKYTGHYDIL
jgi:hypothetical protein